MASTRTVRAVTTIAVGALLSLLIAAPASAHDDSSTSDPVSGSTIDEPITEVTIDFHVAVSGVELGLYPPGDDTVAVPGTTTTQVSDNVATIEFPAITDEGTYIVRYLANADADGHLLVGAKSFIYGSAGGDSSVPWVAFGVAAVLILAVGIGWSVVLHRRANGDDDGRPGGGGSEVDEDLSDVGI